MYNLYFLADKAKVTKGGHWRIVSLDLNKEFEGDLRSVINYATLFFNITPKEIEFALDEMIRKKMDAAHFGLRGSFIYAFDRFEENEKNGGITNGIH